MGMAYVDTYPVPRVRKRPWGMWRVTWCDNWNCVWYREFMSWGDAMRFATTGKNPRGY